METLISINPHQTLSKDIKISRIGAGNQKYCTTTIFLHCLLHCQLPSVVRRTRRSLQWRNPTGGAAVSNSQRKRNKNQFQMQDQASIHNTNGLSMNSTALNHKNKGPDISPCDDEVIFNNSIKHGPSQAPASVSPEASNKGDGSRCRPSNMNLMHTAQNNNYLVEYNASPTSIKSTNDSSKQNKWSYTADHHQRRFVASQPLGDAHASPPPAVASTAERAEDTLAAAATYPIPSARCDTSSPATVPPGTSNKLPSHTHSNSTAPPATLQQHPSDAINASHPPAADISRAAQRTNSAEDTLARTSPTTRDTNIAKSFAPSNGSNHCLSQAPAFTPVSPEASNEGTSQLHARSTARSSPISRPTPLPRPQFTASSPKHVADIRVCTPPLPASDDRDPASTTLDSFSSITDLPLLDEAKIRMTLILIQDRHPELYASLKPESSTDKRRKQSRAAPQKQPNGSGRGGCHWS